MKRETKTLSQVILDFWHRYDEDGVERTIKIDECDRRQVSGDLALYLTGHALLADQLQRVAAKNARVQGRPANQQRRRGVVSQSMIRRWTQQLVKNGFG